jgi:hypothetical protein
MLEVATWSGWDLGAPAAGCFWQDFGSDPAFLASHATDIPKRQLAGDSRGELILVESRCFHGTDALDREV